MKEKDVMAVHEDGVGMVGVSDTKWLSPSGLQTNYKVIVCFLEALMSNEVPHFSIGGGPLWVPTASSVTKTMFMHVRTNYAVLVSSDKKA